MIIVTGGAGFIGSNLVKQLNVKYPEIPIVIVDDLTEGIKFKNINDCRVADYLDQQDFLEKIKQNKYFPKLKAIFHQGACSTTTEWNGKYMMENNFEYSKVLLHYCLSWKVPFIYASSASVYGVGSVFKEELQYEKPINVYAYSKYLFDQYVRNILPEAKSQIVGLRYFNVYGPRESHKGNMASVVLHADQQLRETGIINLFQGNDGYGDGEQQRDFIYVDDAVNINLWFLKSKKSGIYNAGTGHSESFNALAQAVIDFHGRGEIHYIPFPASLQGCYQSFTQADLSKLKAIGYAGSFKPVAEGVKAYLSIIHKSITI
ncbi:ADP-glyceromanno-heptose 6-epimerase [Rickettsiella endosymbiont of Dermanyssus gallinae]|uniref:ADP-glyceromanno-heptose 6-epimerase n=1 Tax=Rickettsiella endosymbiont of Dermanyssus gallinae TaxID=2856608 RepID=UPI001C52AA05|nr:ADP-glyceromanno-heptose 6-epimerase [Rickettsiella endosymbiont of Dermanyssus gallinae]